MLLRIKLANGLEASKSVEDGDKEYWLHFKLSKDRLSGINVSGNKTICKFLDRLFKRHGVDIGQFIK